MWCTQGHSGSVAEMNEMQEGLFGAGGGGVFIFYCYLKSCAGGHAALCVSQLYLFIVFNC